METREFHIGDIISVTTGILVAPGLIESVYKILNFLTGDELFTHQLPRASRECAPYLEMRFPWLKEIDTSEVTTDNYWEWLEKQVEEYGKTHELSPIPEDFVTHKDALQELEQMVDKNKIIVIKE